MEKLYQIATLLYLERASKNFSGQSDTTRVLADTGFSILAEQLDCYAALPILIIGLEARTDQQRIIVLDLIEKSLAKFRSRSLEGVQRMVQTAWIQDDLETDKDLDYVTKVDTIVTSNNIIPTFA
ncbi:hypothetical protein JX265_008087 [Neoarthrinium moseri]|uniref:Uncharacterized protein n=1 Tax=Neoarthrinium moseri TaxID=1658444 RepID=A0A9P9WJ39_9PEZI|nr:uncharacterized protein JN550_004468 [Neoarthrinium moseri]KAI1865764.1 hypothetical protein JX265_008087 [Neoarthrinium moseri]KAI1871474.1 hypothetical protein JN550_004468 [Neoarthrinium moseri]